VKPGRMDDSAPRHLDTLQNVNRSPSLADGALYARLGSRLCDEVQPVRGGQIKRIADERRRREFTRNHI